MNLDAILTLLSMLAPLVPVPAVATGIPALVQIARDLEARGALDTSTPVELTAIGEAHRAALAGLIAELGTARPA